MVKRLLGWTLASLLLGAVTWPGCGTDAVDVDACRRIEYIRCEQGPRCPGLGVSDVESCKRFYRDQCLHGLAGISPRTQDLDDCVTAIQTGTCDVVEKPETAEACTFLIPAPEETAGSGGASGSAGASGSSGQSGAAGTGS